MTRHRSRRPGMRWKFRYDAEWCKPSEPGRRLTFTVEGWNQDEAYVEAKQRLEALGEKDTGAHGDGWWFVGVRRHPR